MFSLVCLIVRSVSFVRLPQGSLCGRLLVIVFMRSFFIYYLGSRSIFTCCNMSEKERREREKKKRRPYRFFSSIRCVIYFVVLCWLDTFFLENNGARMILCGSNDSSVQAASNDTHYDHDIKIIGSRLGP